MKVNKIERLSICLLCTLLFIIGCSHNYQVDTILTGTIEKILVEDKVLVIKEYGGLEGNKKGNKYEIPVEDPSKFELGQKLEITIFSNTDADVWDLDHMKFEVKIIGK